MSANPNLSQSLSTHLSYNKSIMLDRGPQFVAELMKELNNTYGSFLVTDKRIGQSGQQQQSLQLTTKYTQ